MEIVPLGDAALSVRVGDSLGKILQASARLRAARLAEVSEVVPAFASVTLYLATPRSLEHVIPQVQATLQRRAPRAEAEAPRRHEVPVCYDEEFGLDLIRVAQATRLSPNEIVRCHARASYEVRCVGFTPGFPYLSGLPRALATPRRAQPRVQVPAGAVAIGGSQAGIYPLATPGGWNIIGRTPLRLFDPAREPAALLRAGDRVRFRAISREEFEQWEK